MGGRPELLVGCCGWAGARARYFEEFEAVEIQQTFYEPPRLPTLERWKREAPENFHFSLKCFQLVTHDAKSPTYRRLRRPLPRPEAVGSFRETPEVEKAWQETLEAARALGAEVVLLQTPASFRPTEENLGRLRRFVARRAREKTPTLAFEPRGAAWVADETDRLCRELGILRACDPLTTEPPPPSAQQVAYFRLHGIGGYGYRFRDEDLRRVREIARRYGRAWVLFNNVSMREDALRFRALL